MATKEYSFTVSGTFRSGRPFRSDFLVYAQTREEAERELRLCLGTFEEVSASEIEAVAEAEADAYGDEQYREGGSFAVFDPKFATSAGDA